jgi:hypothetical protein
VRGRNAHKLEVPQELVVMNEFTLALVDHNLSGSLSVGSHRDLSRKFGNADCITLTLGMYGRGIARGSGCRSGRQS